MLAYKFRNATQAHQIFDILHYRRLYCANWCNLNDPMEAIFAYSAPQYLTNGASTFALKVQCLLREWRVCSLSETFDSRLLWAHYANGFDGVAIEIKMPDDDANIQRVRYDDAFTGYNYTDGIEVDQAARSIIFSKYKEWSYEQEIRICGANQYYYLENPIERVIAGHRLQEALFDTIQMVCEY